jgi:hypothetical protein
MNTPSSEPSDAADLPPNPSGRSATNIAANPTQSGPANATPANRAPQSSGLQRLRDWIDRLLVADVFLVLAGALWFAVAVLLHSQGVGAPLAIFQRLWEPLFTPAIGLLMAAALLSGALGWWQRRGQR